MAISLVNNLLANQVALNLAKNQDALQSSVTKLSSGLRINTAADDPSGLAIAEELQSQVNGFDQAVSNVQDATNAATVADGALQTTTDILQRIRSLAVEASSDISTQADKGNLQTEVTQLLQEVNTILASRQQPTPPSRSQPMRRSPLLQRAWLLAVSILVCWLRRSLA
jgi:flagellin